MTDCAHRWYETDEYDWCSECGLRVVDGQSWQGPYRDGRVHVLAAKCKTCIFRPGDLMHLGEERFAHVVGENLQSDAALTCHATLPGTGQQGSVCRGFFDVHKRDTSPLRLAVALNLIEEVPCPE